MYHALSLVLASPVNPSPCLLAAQLLSPSLVVPSVSQPTSTSAAQLSGAWGLTTGLGLGGEILETSSPCIVNHSELSIPTSVFFLRLFVPSVSMNLDQGSADSDSGDASKKIESTEPMDT